MKKIEFDILPLKDNLSLLPKNSFFRGYWDKSTERKTIILKDNCNIENFKLDDDFFDKDFSVEPEKISKLDKSNNIYFEETDVPDDMIIRINGDFEADEICLDYELFAKIFKVNPNLISALVVTGNLKIKNNIWNKNTDGAVCLYVHGNAEVSNMVVGGSEIMIEGDLTVRGFFWGDYNHGTCEVKKNFYSQALLLTDEYHFSVKGENRCKNTVEGNDGSMEVENFILENLPAEFLLYDESGGDDGYIYPGRAKLLKKMNANSESFTKHFNKTIPPVFKDDRISYKNILRVSSSIFAENPDREFSFTANGVSFKAGKDFNDDYYEYNYVFIEKKKAFKFVIMSYIVSDKLRNEINYFKKNEKRVPILYYDLSKKNTDAILLKESPIEIQNILYELWKIFIEKLAEYEYYRGMLAGLINVKTIKSMLDLPVAYAHPYYSEDHSFWIDNLGMSFRQQGEMCSEGVPHRARVGFSLPVIDSDGEEQDIEQFLFDIEDYGTENEKMEFYYFSNSLYDAGEDPRVVNLDEIELVKRALVLLKRFHYYINNNLHPEIFGKWKNNKLVKPPEKDYCLTEEKETEL